jgi:uncharacterized protein YdeI (YjbR/CyaY-like superfamily)
MKKAATVGDYIAASGPWREALESLREVLQSTGLDESIKWGMPVYTLHGKNVAGFSSFKSWVGLWFYQGVFLKDPDNVLVNAQEGITKGLRQWRFASAEEIRSRQDAIRSYLQEAIRNRKEGKEIQPERNKPLVMPEELERAFRKDPSLKDSFEALSPSKRREYAEYVGSAKLEETRRQRLEKVLPLILEGIGLNDKYRK